MVYINMNNHYEHYNRTLGKHIRNKNHYNEELKRGGYVHQEQGDDEARAYEEKRENRKYKTSPEYYKFMESVKGISDSKGNVKLGDKQVKYMEEQGMCLNTSKIHEFFGKEDD